MIIHKDEILEVEHRRKGYFIAKASKDFDLETSEFYPLILVTRIAEGLNTYWKEGEEIPCRGSLCEVRKIQGGV